MSLSAPRRIWILVVCGAAACAPRAQPAGSAPSADAARHRLWSVVDTLVLDRAAAIARYGPPVAVVADTIRGLATPEVLDSIARIQFRTFESLYYVHRAGRTELRHVTIAGHGTTVPAAVAPGASRRSLVGFLGPPDDESVEAEGVLLFYALRTDGEDGNVLNILLVDDRVRWISWVFFPDEPSWPTTPR